jgi:hypothetical protein
MQGLAKTLFKNLEAVPNGAMSSHRCEDFLGGARKLERLSQDGERADFSKNLHPSPFNSDQLNDTIALSARSILMDTVTGQSL